MEHGSRQLIGASWSEEERLFGSGTKHEWVEGGWGDRKRDQRGPTNHRGPTKIIIK